ncbi:hypothetical protein F4805DRAFT_458161 [Annulohypoxylon moriforme]|nr:hypothetical protein F4805DRAFT_458161 [Annulohypoxylon moriforme]
MENNSNSPRRSRVISLIARICGMEGIRTPQFHPSTDGATNPLSTRQVELLEIVVDRRTAVERIMANDDGGSPDSSAHDDSSAAIDSDSADSGGSDNVNGGPAIDQAPEEAIDPLTCHECGKHFKTKMTFQQHDREVHIGTRCYWPGCTFTTTTEALLNRHLHTHQGDEHVRCKWPGCKSAFKMKESLLRHLRRHNISARRG